MKKFKSYFLVAMLTFASTFCVFAQSEETRQVSGFHAISSAGPFDVHIKITGTESLKLKANPDIINEIITKVENGNLKIKVKDHDEWERHHIGKVDVYITAKSLSGLSNAGSGNMKVEGDLSGDKIDFSLSGSGDISSAVKAGDLHISISGSGSVHLNGHSDKADVSIAGSGEMLGKEFKTNSASISIAGSGNAYLKADKNISANIVGSGSVIYSGNATSNASTIGSGRVRKVD